MTPATRLARLVVEALAAAGVGHVVLCPGSRSAPLAYALLEADAAGGPRLHVRHDERVAGFTALGAGGAVVTTSGTAVANLHPAVLEAHHADRPLVVVSADRPPVLRGTWANQTSELQADLFGAAVRARLDLADTDAAKDPDAARAALDAAIAASRGASPSGRPGPVHLNLGLSEPLVPDDDTPVWSPPPLARPLPPAPAPGRRYGLRPGPRTVVLAGDGDASRARAIAEAAAAPLLAEPSSGARGGPNAVGPYQLLLDRPGFGDAVERVVAVGRPTLSRPVTRLLARADVEVVLVSPYAGYPDPGRDVVRCTSVEVTSPGEAGWLAWWTAAGAAAAAAVDTVLDDDARAGRLTGPLVAREVSGALRPGELLHAAASNPIRDLDIAARPHAGSGGLAIVANRGLAGIDGTVSAASGLALAGRRVRVLVGDLAFLHDANALLLPPGEARPDVQVIVVNDSGGGIFSLLEYGALGEGSDAAGAAFERLFGTPQRADLAALAAGYGVPYRLARDLVELRSALADPMPGPSVVEVPVSRADRRDLSARLRAAVAEALAEPSA